MKPTRPRLVGKPARVRTIGQKQQKPAVHELIELRAYELFLQDGCAHGRDLDHWLTAERELLEVEKGLRPGKRVARATA